MLREPPMAGFPPEPESRVTLANWQEPPYNRWSFQHVREVIPTQPIPRGPGPTSDLVAQDAPGLDEVAVRCLGDRTSSFAEVMARTWTDAVLVLHDGRLVLERYTDQMEPPTAHLLMSVTKSVVGCVTGILADQGLLDVDAPATRYVPELAESGYRGATVRQLLDMRTGVAFREEYTNPDAEVRLMERHMGWRPGPEAEQAGGLYAYLLTLDRAGAHGGRFVYRSADTDVLGWVCERAADTRMADLISLLIWQPMGAEFDANITCDWVGSAVHDGGLSARARDVARFGQLLLDDGRARDRPVVPAIWLRQARTLDPEIRAAFAASDAEPFFTGGWYHNQFWFMPGPLGDLQICLGIHGQMVLVDRATRTVSVKLSSWPEAQEPTALLDTVRAFSTLGRHLAGLSETAEAAGRHGGPTDIAAGRRRRLF
jgi:CubicO group peptidase (beta-lactamase class C family)